MKLEQQVITLEQARKLKELGIEQESQFYHVPWKASDFEGVFIGQTCNKGFYQSIDGEVETFDGPEYYSAFTVAELGAMLPTYEDEVGIYYSIKDIGKSLSKDAEGEIIGFSVSESFSDSPDIISAINGVFRTEAEARAATLIYLLEDKKTTPSECNSRLTA